MSILNPFPERLLLGPGPSNAHPAVLEAMSLPLLGHLDPEFIALLDRVKEGLRTCFGTVNAMTLPISATGSAGMEAALVNLLEPGETVVVGINGVFGVRMAEVARRAGRVNLGQGPGGLLKGAGQGRPCQILLGRPRPRT